MLNLPCDLIDLSICLMFGTGICGQGGSVPENKGSADEFFVGGDKRD